MKGTGPPGARLPPARKELIELRAPTYLLMAGRTIAHLASVLNRHKRSALRTGEVNGRRRRTEDGGLSVFLLGLLGHVGSRRVHETRGPGSDVVVAVQVVAIHQPDELARVCRVGCVARAIQCAGEL